MELDATRPETFHDLERIEGRSEQTVQLGRDDNIATLQLGEQQASNRAILDRNRTATFLDHNPGERQPVHERVALDLALLDLEAFA